MACRDDAVDVIVVGGGIVGCASALALAGSGRFESIILLERRPFLGDGTSTRNSYVIHAGLYYEPGSLKARFCVEGNRMMYEFCARHGVDHRRSGKLVVARDAKEVEALERLERNGMACGARDLRILDRADLRRIEPNIEAHAAIHSPSTGVFDVAQWFRTAEGLLFEQGVTVLKGTRVVGVEPGDGFFDVVTENRGRAAARFLVNAAGLFSDEVAGFLGRDHRIHPCRGDYFVVPGPKRDLVRGAVYPLPGQDGLGIHLTKLCDGTVLIGPDTRYVESKEDYSDMPVFDEAGDLRLDAPVVREFYESSRSLLPALEPTDMRLAHCGIRPKLAGPGEGGFRDFVIERDPRFPGAIHLVGIDSPGLTAALPIGDYVVGLVGEMA